MNGQNEDSRLTAWADIPAELRQRPQWVAWRYVVRDGKRTKAPVYPFTGENASVSDPDTWGTFEEAARYALNDGGDGIGFVLTEGDPYVGVDLDTCRDANSGAVAPWAQDLVDRLGSYAEVSPSGTGIRVFVRGRSPAGTPHKEDREPGSIEVYDRGRFLTTTGHAIGRNDGIEERGDALRAITGQTEPAPEPDDEVYKASAIAQAATLSNLKDRLVVGGVGYREIRRSYAVVLQLDRCLVHPEHGGTGGYVLVYPDGYPLYRCPHNTCKGVGWKDVAGVLGTRPHKTIETSDAGNAVRMARRHGQDLRYVAVTKTWLIWDGRRWAADRNLRVRTLAKETAFAIYDEAREVAGWGHMGADQRDALQKKLAKWAVYSQMEKQITNMIASLASEPGMGITPEELDAHPNLLNCRNGTLDLDTVELRPHDRDDLLTKLTGCDYDPDALSEMLTRFLDDSTSGYPEVGPFLRRLAGHTLVGKNTEEVMVFLLGEAGSGKTTLLQAMKAAMGDYAREADFETFISSDHGQGGRPRPDLARLAGARYVLTSEPDPNKKLDLSRIKAMTGGDAITVRNLYTQDFEMEPAFTPWIAANQPPRIDDNDSGIWRRLLRVPMENSRPLGKRDPSVKAELTDAARSGAAVLAWMVRGHQEWKADGLQIPAVVLEKTEELREEMNPLRDFLESRCVFEPDASTKSSVLYAAYTAWAKAAGIRFTISQKGFSDRMKQRGLDKKRQKDGEYWQGVGLIPLVEVALMEMNSTGGSGQRAV